MHYGQSIVAGLIIGLGGFAGALCVSAMKRDLHIETSGCSLRVTEVFSTASRA